MFLTPVVNLFQTIVNKAPADSESAREAQSWEELETAYLAEEIVVGYLDHKVERGYMIRFGEVMGFSPRYRFDLCEYDEVPEVFINEPLPFIILSLDLDNEHLVVSRIDAVSELYSDYLDSLEKNQVIEGTVSAVMDKLVTVDLGGLTCLISKNEVSWRPVSHPSNLISVGENLRIKLLKVVPAKAYLTASLKQLDTSCWKRFADTHDVGSVVPVRISNVTDFGYFVTYDEKLSGILHWSELAWKPRNKQQVMVYSKGDCLDVKISELDHEKQRVSFSLKAMQPDPAEEVFSLYQVGDVVTGVVRSRTDFGLFVEISENFNGLLHFSNLSWFTNSKNNLANFRPGMYIRSKIIELDKENERVGLGLKQLCENPFAEQPSLHSLSKSVEFPRTVTIAVSSFFQANCHNQVVAMLEELKYKMRQHIDLQIDSLFFDENDVALPDIIVVLMSNDFFKSEAKQAFKEYLAQQQGLAPLIIPIVAETICEDISDPLLELAKLPVDGKPLQQWRVKSAYWSTIHKSLIRSVRYVAGLK